MIRNTLSSLAALAALTCSVTAQQPCTDNEYQLHLTDADGNPAPVIVDPLTNANFFDFDGEAVYLAFDPTIPTGTYYVHVTDEIDGIGDVVLSTNDPMDRIVSVTNTGGVITLSLPFSSNTPVTGLGLNGVGESLLLQPFTNNPNRSCHFKAWFGDSWDLTNGPQNPYLIAGGLHPTTGQCAVRSYENFRIGDGTGTDVTGCVFDDQNENGVRDPGEPGLPGWEVSLVDGTSTVTVQTDGTGCYTFVDVACANYTVELTIPSGFLATTPASYAVEVCGCADVVVDDFGVHTAVLACDARTIGYWRNRHGLMKVHQFGILAQLPALGIVDRCGQRVAPGTLRQYRRWLRRANAWNMAYMLSAQLVAMHNNVTVGFVDPNCVIDDPCLGQITIDDLMQQAVMSLWAHPFTPPCSQHRRHQAKLKNALDRANNNQIWL